LLKLLKLNLLLLESLSVGESALEGLGLLLLQLLMIGIVHLRHHIHLHVLILLHLVSEELNRGLEWVVELLHPSNTLTHIVLVLIGEHLIVHRMVLLRHALITHLMLRIGVSDATGTAVLPIELLSLVSNRASLEIVALILLRET
jgi:hypothetical protein